MIKLLIKYKNLKTLQKIEKTQLKYLFTKRYSRVIKVLYKKRQEEIRKLQQDKLRVSKLLQDTGFLKGAIDEAIKFNKERIQKLSIQIRDNEDKLARTKNSLQRDNKTQLDLIDRQSNRSIKPLQDNLRKNQALIDKYNDDLNNIADRNRENLVEIGYSEGNRQSSKND